MDSNDRRERRPWRAPTQVLTEGFDPSLSVGSARPAVFRSSTYVFSSPEAAERAFDVASGRAEAAEGESPELMYSRFNHPNAEMLEDQIVHLEKDSASALAFNSGMSAIVTSLFSLLDPGQWPGHARCVNMDYHPYLKEYFGFLCSGWADGDAGSYDAWVVESDALTGPLRNVAYFKGTAGQGYFVCVRSKFLRPDSNKITLFYSANWRADRRGIPS
jgi:cystathionine beta-lyase/cystathionine gamma-synthase